VNDWKSTLGFLLLGFFPVTPSWGDVWQRSGDGEITLHRTLDHFQRSRMADHWSPPSLEFLVERRQEYADLIALISTQHGVPSDLVAAIIEVESAFDERAVSRAGAMGIMQLLPKTAKRFSVIDPLDAEQNIDAGVRYLRLLMHEFESRELVLAAYNAGEEAVRRYGNKVPPYAETQTYIERVMLLLTAPSDRWVFSENEDLSGGY